MRQPMLLRNGLSCRSPHKGDKDLMIITATGVMIQTNVANISQTGRSTMGVRMRLDRCQDCDLYNG